MLLQTELQAMKISRRTDPISSNNEICSLLVAKSRICVKAKLYLLALAKLQVSHRSLKWQ
jgi:hypothetical protein